MSVHSWSGTVTCLLVLCLRAGCAASQQQQQPAALLGVTTDEFLSLMSRAVQAELQPILSRLEARVEDLDRRLEARVENLDRKLEARLEDLDRKLEARLEDLDRRLEAREDLDRKLEARVEDLDRRLEARLEDLDRKLEAREDLDRLQSQLAAVANSTGVQSRVDGAANETAGQQPQADEVTSRPDQAEDIDQPRDCSEMPPGTTSGVYPVWPDRSQDPVQAFCQEDSEGGEMWTVFQRRDDILPRQDFYLGWEAYRRGFGNLTKEFWWGLEHLHKLTAEADRPYQLRVDLEAFDGAKAHASYRTFRVSTEEEGYRLTVSGYTGTARDSLIYSNSRGFSTRDRDNDGWPWGSCAEQYRGAWWYGLNCGLSSLNGRYLEDGHHDQTGIWWYRWRRNESLTKTQMMLRPA